MATRKSPNSVDEWVDITPDATSGEWEDVTPPKSLSGFASNVGKGVGQLAAGVGQMIAHPIDTLGGLAAIGLGGAQRLIPALTQDLPAEKRAEAEQAIQSVIDSYKTRYGQGVGEALYDDPIGVAGDVATVTGAGGAAAKAVSMPRTATALNVASKITNPMTAPSKLIGKAAVGTTRARQRVGNWMYEHALKPPSHMDPPDIARAVNTGMRNRVPVTGPGITALDPSATPLTATGPAPWTGRPLFPMFGGQPSGVERVRSTVNELGAMATDRARTMTQAGQQLFPFSSQRELRGVRKRFQTPAPGPYQKAIDDVEADFVRAHGGDLESGIPATPYTPSQGYDEMINFNNVNPRFFRGNEPLGPVRTEAEAALARGQRLGLNAIAKGSGVPGVSDFPHIRQEMGDWLTLKSALDPRVRAGMTSGLSNLSGMYGLNQVLGPNVAVPATIARTLLSTFPGVTSRAAFAAAPWTQGIRPVVAASRYLPAGFLAARPALFGSEDEWSPVPAQ